MHYRFSGLVSCENDARQICRLLENLNPKPIGCGFTEIDLTKKIWEVDAYFNYVIKSSIVYLLEKLYSVKFQFNEINYFAVFEIDIFKEFWDSRVFYRTEGIL